MKTLRGFIVGLIVAGVIGGVAGAAPAIHRLVPHSLGSTTEAPRSTAAKTPVNANDDDFLATLTGLANAIDHVSQNLADHPNKGLANALAHLQANKAKHEAHDAAKGNRHEQKGHDSGGERESPDEDATG